MYPVISSSITAIAWSRLANPRCLIIPRNTSGKSHIRTVPPASRSGLSSSLCVPCSDLLALRHRSRMSLMMNEYSHHASSSSHHHLPSHVQHSHHSSQDTHQHSSPQDYQPITRAVPESRSYLLNPVRGSSRDQPSYTSQSSSYDQSRFTPRLPMDPQRRCRSSAARLTRNAHSVWLAHS